MKPPFLIPLLAAALLVGCVSAGQTYVKQHPDMSEAHKRIILTGKIPDGDAVAGLTRDEIQLAMGVEPSQYLKVDGHDAWVYARKRLTQANLMATSNSLEPRDRRNKSDLPDSSENAQQNMPETRITVFFDGNVATHAEVISGGATPASTPGPQ